MSGYEGILTLSLRNLYEVKTINHVLIKVLIEMRDIFAFLPVLVITIFIHFKIMANIYNFLYSIFLLV